MGGVHRKSPWTLTLQNSSPTQLPSPVRFVLPLPLRAPSPPSRKISLLKTPEDCETPSLRNPDDSRVPLSRTPPRAWEPNQTLPHRFRLRPPTSKQPLQVPQNSFYHPTPRHTCPFRTRRPRSRRVDRLVLGSGSS